MREILYKAKKFDKTTWAKGQPFEYYENWYIVENNKKYKIEKPSLCESTHFVDSYGNKIFENDIVLKEIPLNGKLHKFKGLVTIIDGVWHLVPTGHKLHNYTNVKSITSTTLKSALDTIGAVRVIGNLHG